MHSVMCLGSLQPRYDAAVVETFRFREKPLELFLSLNLMAVTAAAPYAAVEDSIRKFQFLLYEFFSASTGCFLLHNYLLGGGWK